MVADSYEAKKKAQQGLHDAVKLIENEINKICFGFSLK